MPGRHANILSGLVAPDWSNRAADVFRERFLEWEVAVQRYEVQSDGVLGDALRVAGVRRHSPPEVRAALQAHITRVGTDYQRLRALVNDIFTSGLEYNSSVVMSGAASTNVTNGAVPMEVGALSTVKGKGHEG